MPAVCHLAGKDRIPFVFVPERWPFSSETGRFACTYVKGKTLYIKAMNTEDTPGGLMINVESIEVLLTDEQVNRLKEDGLYSSKGFRLE